VAIYTLSGSGLQPLNAGLRGLHVHLTRYPFTYKNGQANPTNLYDVGLLRVGNAYGFREVRPLDGLDMWVPVDSDTTRLGYSVFSNGEISVEEVAAAPVVPTLTEVWQRNPAAWGTLAYREGSTAVGDTVGATYTVPAGRRLMLSGVELYVSVRDAAPASSRFVVEAYIGSARIGQLQTFRVGAGSFDSIQCIGASIFLAAGDVFTMHYSTTASSGFFVTAGVAHGTLFDA